LYFRDGTLIGIESILERPPGRGATPAKPRLIVDYCFGFDGGLLTGGLLELAVDFDGYDAIEDLDGTFYRSSAPLVINYGRVLFL
jgi:hypothetical protein